MNEVITTNYSENHKALDIVSEDHNETEIIALESGTVTAVVRNMKSTNNNTKGIATYGNFVKIKQDNGKTALYAHLKFGTIKVNNGQYITKGTVIGTMGATGNAYGKHLHLEIKNESGINENPILDLNKENIKKSQNEQKPQNEENVSQINETVIQKQENNIKDEKEIYNLKEEKTIEQSIENTQNNQDPYNVKSENKENIYHTTTPIPQYLSNYEYKNGSIVDALKNINIDSSYDYRKLLAEKNGIENYHGSFDQNVKLLNLLKEGKLIKA